MGGGKVIHKNGNAPLTIDLLPDGSEALAGAFTVGEYYGGQFTALYALASSGSLELYAGEGLDRLHNELTVAVSLAYELGDIEDAENMTALLHWVRTEMAKG